MFPEFFRIDPEMSGKCVKNSLNGTLWLFYLTVVQSIPRHIMAYLPHRCTVHPMVLYSGVTSSLYRFFQHFMAVLFCFFTTPFQYFMIGLPHFHTAHPTVRYGCFTSPIYNLISPLCNRFTLLPHSLNSALYGGAIHWIVYRSPHALPSYGSFQCVFV